MIKQYKNNLFHSIVLKNPRILQNFCLLILSWSMLFPQMAWAMRPVFSAFGLVAGYGPAGYRDGSFTSSQFNAPMGAAISTDGTRLFIADSNNNRIRVIHLDEDNQVTTLAGKSEPGDRNGTLDSALFNEPRSLAYLPDNKLVINDYGNKLLRLVDLKTRVVSTLGGDSPTTLTEGPASRISMAGIQNLVYLPAAGSLFFTQPDQGSLKKLDLKTNKVSSLSFGGRPDCLCVSGDKLYFSDADQPQILMAKWASTQLSNPQTVAQTPSHVLSLASSGDDIYAVQLDNNAPLVHLLPQNYPVTFISAWGDMIPQPGISFAFFANLITFPAMAMVSDPFEARKLYIVNPFIHRITYFRDIDPYHDPNLDFPNPKPPKTFRILLVGDSRAEMLVKHPFLTNYNIDDRAAPPQASLFYRLQLTLNTLAALENVPVNFEVKLDATSGDQGLFLWPAYRVPDTVIKNNIDLVLVLQATADMGSFPFRFYCYNTLNADGIPKYPRDLEYMLKPPLERIPPGDARRFYDLCNAKKFVRVEQNGFNFDEKLFSDPDLYPYLVRLYGKPLDVLKQKLSKLRTSTGKPVSLVLCDMHSSFFKPDSEPPEIWKDITQQYHIPYVDLNDEMTAMINSYYPLAEVDGNGHFNSEGHLLFGELLAYGLIRDKLIPWK